MFLILKMQISVVLLICHFSTMIAESKDSEGFSHLINANNKCLAVPRDSPENGAILIQWDCIDEKGQQWSHDQDKSGSKDSHICNGHKKCVGSPGNSKNNVLLIQWDHSDEEGQKFQFEKSENKTDFYHIKNGHDKCLAVAGNNKENAAYVVAWDCITHEDGQLWKWYKL